MKSDSISKKKIEEIIVRSIYFEGPLDDVTGQLLEWQELYKDWYNLRIKDTSSGYDEEMRLSLVGDRDETDKEYTKRMNILEKDKAKRKIALEKYRTKVEKEAKKLGLIK